MAVINIVLGCDDMRIFIFILEITYLTHGICLPHLPWGQEAVLFQRLLVLYISLTVQIQSLPCVTNHFFEKKIGYHSSLHTTSDLSTTHARGKGRLVGLEAAEKCSSPSHLHFLKFLSAQQLRSVQQVLDNTMSKTYSREQSNCPSLHHG